MLVSNAKPRDQTPGIGVSWEPHIPIEFCHPWCGVLLGDILGADLPLPTSLHLENGQKWWLRQQNASSCVGQMRERRFVVADTDAGKGLLRHVRTKKTGQIMSHLWELLSPTSDAIEATMGITAIEVNW